MTVERLPFTDRALATLPFAVKGQLVVRDSDLAGFFVRIGTGTKTYMVQGDLWTDGRRQSLSIRVGEARFPRVMPVPRQKCYLAPLRTV